MKRWVKVLAALALVIPILAVLGFFGAFWYPGWKYQRVLAGQMKKVERLWKLIAPQLQADEALWARDPLILPHQGPDAAPLLSQHFQWELDGGTALKPVFPQPLMDKLTSDAGQWPEHVGLEDLQGVELDWLAQLGSFGVWDLEGEGPLRDLPINLADDPHPNFRDAFLFAKARLAQGLARGDARPAGQEVRELSRLCLSTERFWGESVGVGLLTVERRAFDEAKRRHQSVEGWNPRSSEEVEALRRLIGVAHVPLHLLAGPTLAKPELTVGRCAALYESLSEASLLRDLLGEAMADAYAGRKAALDASPCRLRRLRAAWAVPRPADPRAVEASAYCGWKRDACPPEARALKWIPLLGSISGTLIIPPPAKLFTRYPFPDAGTRAPSAADGGTPATQE